MSSLNPNTWQAQLRTHKERVDHRLSDYLSRRNRGEKQPVLDFLFEYYRFRPGRLARWSPGVGVVLEDGAREFADQTGFTVQGHDAWVDAQTVPEKRKRSFRWIVELLERTAERPAFHGCFGLHEWAMVYRTEDPRHNVPMRMSPDALAHFVESRSVLCTHYDAFRFFTPEARPLNHRELQPDDVLEHEQPGCLHANMDLYRWAFKGYPWIPSDLIINAFDLAVCARTLDMRASPYDLRDAGYPPIAIETVEGRAAYQAAQRDVADRAQPLRLRVIEAYRRVIEGFSPSPRDGAYSREAG